MTKTKSPIIVALDGMTMDQARILAHKLGPYVAGFKANNLLLSNGVFACTELGVLGAEVMADPKLYDIPNTMANSVKELDGCTYITVHASNSADALATAREAATASRILGITLLTSFTEEECQAVNGISIEETVLMLAKRCMNAKFFGLVCSPKELLLLNEAGLLSELKAVVPGVRSIGEGRHDQKRVMTPREAIRDGAYRIVVGREIIESSDPVKAAQIINDDCAEFVH